MNCHAIPNFLAAILILLTGIFATLKNRKSKINFLFFLLTSSAFIWQLGTGLAMSARSSLSALIATRIAFLGIALIPVFSYHLSLYICARPTNKMLNTGYVLALLFFIPLSWTLLIFNGVYSYSWGFFFKAGQLHPVFMIFFIYYMLLVFLNLFLSFKRETKPLEKNRKKYLLIALFIAYIGSVDYLPTYGIRVYPFGYVTLICFVLIFAYAILRFRIMDINLALTRAGIFIVVYALVLGIPFWLGYATKAWWPATALAVILATVGPFIYQHLRRRAEDLILKEQRRYQRALRELSKTMTRIRDLDKLLKMIVLSVVDTVKVSSAGIYLKDEDYKSYRLKHYFPKIEARDFPEFVSSESPLIKGLYNQKRPLMQEEVGSADTIPLHSGLVIPCFMEDELLGFLVMGAKPNNQIYTADDLLVFETLSYSTSLAIENCRFWKEIEDRQRKARLKEMDTYSYSLAHEIDNPMQVVIGQTNLLKKYLLKEINLPEAKQKEMDDSFEFILEAVHRVSGMVKAIRDFGSPTTGELKPLKIEEVVDSFIRLYMPQLKNNAVSLVKELPSESILTRGEKPELMQVLVILANNSLHAMRYSREKKITIKVEQPSPDISRIIFTDTGHGIKKELLPVIFSPFTTTKASTEGTGMGLYNAKKIIERHKGRLWVESEGENKGTVFFIELPVAKDITPEELENLKFKEGDYKKKKLF